MLVETAEKSGDLFNAVIMIPGHSIAFLDSFLGDEKQQSRQP
jgi:hypothetical protein